jgi:hypothetical protein
MGNTTAGPGDELEKIVAVAQRLASNGVLEVYRDHFLPYPDGGVTERGTGHKVDVLLKLGGFITPVWIAIECRDRSRPQGMDWINEIHATYEGLPVSHIIAVSRNGFRKSAIQRARRFGNIHLQEYGQLSQDDVTALLPTNLMLEVDIVFKDMEIMIRSDLDPGDAYPETFSIDFMSTHVSDMMGNAVSLPNLICHSLPASRLLNLIGEHGEIIPLRYDLVEPQDRWWAYLHGIPVVIRYLNVTCTCKRPLPSKAPKGGTMRLVCTEGVQPLFNHVHQSYETPSSLIKVDTVQEATTGSTRFGVEIAVSRDYKIVRHLESGMLLLFRMYPAQIALDENFVPDAD